MCKFIGIKGLGNVKVCVDREERAVENYVHQIYSDNMCLLKMWIFNYSGIF